MWDDYFLNMAVMVSTKSHCINRQVGTVLVKNKRMIATGYNGLPSGFPNCKNECYVPQRVSGSVLEKLPCEHAEKNALIQCATFGISCKNAVCYVTTMPCNTCLKALISAGIASVVYMDEYYYHAQEDADLREYLLKNAYKVNGFMVRRHIPTPATARR